jgi:hypothetical protein
LQLNGAPKPALRTRLGAAACMLIASAAAARADGVAGTSLDGAMLIYGEENRTNVVEPVLRITKVRPSGQALSAQLALDVITGASPTGATPSGQVQTTTTPSGNAQSTSATEVPTVKFNDVRAALDLDFTQPLGLIPTIGGHFSREKDYQSLGVNGKLNLSLFGRRTTLTGGGGLNDDSVFPIHGVVEGLTDGVQTGETSVSKSVSNALVGISQVVTRRWLVGVSASRTIESGYLTDPYKVLSVIDANGYPISTLREKRPDSRVRNSLLASSIYHFGIDVLNLSYRAYRDDWGVNSNTVELKLRHDIADDKWVEPHVRYYSQTAANFFRYSLNDGDPLPEFASADSRLGSLRTATVGATYGFKVSGYPGEFSVRGEYMGQWGDGHPPDAVGVQKTFDLMPLQNIGSLMVGYSVGW